MPTDERKPCRYCKSTKDRQAAVRLKRHKHRKAFTVELKAAKESGKVVTLYDVDEFTGIHYRINKHGQFVWAGRGRYNNA